MTKEQARALIRAAAALPEEIGKGSYFRWLDDSATCPCCAVGHLAWPLIGAGVGPLDAPYRLRETFGVSIGRIQVVNDDASPEDRRAAVIAEIERQIGEACLDPDALRSEGGAA